MNTAIYAYTQGETSIVEFMDAINAFIDGSILDKEVELNLNRSFYELEKVVGRSIKDFENIQEQSNKNDK